MRSHLIAAAFALAAQSAFAADATGLAVEGAYARAAGAGTNSAVYFTLRNTGNSDDTLTGASSQVAAMTQLHESKMNGTMMTMAPLGDLVIPPGGTVEFKPGGKHVMLMGLKEQLKAGGHFEIVLSFKTAGAKTVPVEIRDIGASGPMTMPMH